MDSAKTYFKFHVKNRYLILKKQYSEKRRNSDRKKRRQAELVTNQQSKDFYKSAGKNSADRKIVGTLTKAFSKKLSTFIQLYDLFLDIKKFGEDSWMQIRFKKKLDKQI